jgi:cardiolipin synthase
MGVGAAVGAALTHRRVLGPADANLLAVVAVILIAVAVTGVLWPWALSIPIAVITAWLGVVTALKVLRLRRARPTGAERGARKSEP